MADLQKPGPTKRALPFKRTARPAQSSSSSSIDDDGLSLFSQSKTYFDTVVEEQKRRAREKAEQAEKERQEKLARQREEEQKSYEIKQRLKREQEELEAEKQATKKRPRSSNSSNGGGIKDETLSDDDDDAFTERPRKSCKSFTPFSPEAAHTPSTRRVSRSSNQETPRPLSHKAVTPVVLLDSSDDEDSKFDASSSKMRSSVSRTDTTFPDSQKVKVKDDDSDSDLEILDSKFGDNGQKEGAEEDPSEFYIRQAMERRRKEKEAREARKARRSSAAGETNKGDLFVSDVKDEPSPPVSVMIAAPTLPEAKPICCTVRTSQALQIAFDTFKERLKVQTHYPHKVISGLYFTWRSDRVYDTTKLETLGIRPLGHDGRLHNGLRKAPEGYMGRDKVYFEALTPEEYEEHQAKRERARKRREMGEWWDDDEASDQEGNAAASEAEAAKEEERVKVTFKARNMPPRNVTLRKFSTVAQMIKAFRKLTGLGEDKHVEIRWDGEVLEPETTVEEADIQDMDSVEVHVR